MIIPLQDFDATFQNLVSRSTPIGSTTILILTSPTPDSICALKILTSLLQNHLLAHAIKPVSSYTHLLQIYNSDVLENAEIKTCILVGCGVLVDLVDHFGIEEQDSVQFYVIDSHRPANLGNLYSNENVWCFDDGGFDPAVRDAYMSLVVCK